MMNIIKMTKKELTLLQKKVKCKKTFTHTQFGKEGNNTRFNPTHLIQV